MEMLLGLRYILVSIYEKHPTPCKVLVGILLLLVLFTAITHTIHFLDNKKI